MIKETRRKVETDEAAAPRTRGVSRNSETARRKILDAAILIFGQQGFAGASTEQIAERAGYGQATIFFHFKTKAGLLKACLDDALDRARSTLIPADHSGTVDLVRRLDNAFDDHPKAEFFARMMTELGSNSAFRLVYAEFHAHIRAIIDTELQRETGADPARTGMAAAMILSMMVGIHAEHRLENERFTRNDYRQMLLTVTRLILKELNTE
jgi:AcrR family transcriptional regulator